MPAKGPVSILWQIIFTFIPVLDLYAFYRIKKLRKYLLFVIVPPIVIIIGISTTLVSEELESQDFIFEEEPLTGEDEAFASLIFLPLEIGFQILAIYLVYTWSKRWNERYSKTS